MNAPGGRLPTMLLGAAGILLFLLLTSGWLIGSDDSPQFEPFFRPVAAVSQSDFSVHITEQAVLKARRSVILSSDLPSNQAKVLYLAAEGAMLEAGEVVARFDDSVFREQIEKINNEIRNETANLTQLAAERKLQQLERRDEGEKLAQQVELASMRLSNLRAGDQSLRLARSQRDVDAARSELAKATRSLDMQEELFSKGLTHAKAREEASDLLREKEAAYRIAAQNLRAIKEVTLPSEIRQVQLQYESRERMYASFLEARAHKDSIYAANVARLENKLAALRQDLARAEENLARTTITAPTRGMVLYKELTLQKEKRKVQVGDSLWNRQGFAVMPDMASMIAELKVRESQLGFLQSGQSASIIPRAFPELSLAGRVETIGTLASDSTSAAARFFTVRVALDASDPRLRPGMTARASILVSDIAAATLVPVEAVFYEDAQPVCFLWRNGNPRRVAVELGVSDGDRIEVVTGLQPEDEVMLVYPQTFET